MLFYAIVDQSSCEVDVKISFCPCRRILPSSLSHTAHTCAHTERVATKFGKNLRQFGHFGCIFGKKNLTELAAAAKRVTFVKYNDMERICHFVMTDQ